MCRTTTLTCCVLLAVFFLAACSPPRPLRIGLLASLSGSNADLGEAGRNGAQLAVEDAAGDAQPGEAPLELIVRDDRTDQNAAAAATTELIDAGVQVIIGPFSTAMAEAALPVCTERRVLLFSPSVSALKFTGQDDLLIRMNSSTRDNAGYYASFLREKRNKKHIVLLVDTVNATFARSWAQEFLDIFTRDGKSQARALEFNSADNPDYGLVLADAGKTKPDALLLVTNSVVSARIVQRLRKTDQSLYVIAAEWAGTRQLTELAGKAGEGMEVLQIYDSFGTQGAYTGFVQRYFKRFSSQPSYSSILAWEATTLLIKAFRKHPDLAGLSSGQAEAIRDVIIRDSPYQGLQDEIRFDRFGDSRRRPYFVTISQGAFKKAE